MASFSGQIIAVLFIFFVISPSSVRSGQIQVNLSNDIGYDSLKVSCKSNTGKDLGQKLMGPGTSFTWAADINVPGEDEIWRCAMSGTPVGGLDGEFAIFISRRDNTAARCPLQKCLWSVRQDGIYLYISDYFGFQLQFTWPN